MVPATRVTAMDLRADTKDGDRRASGEATEADQEAIMVMVPFKLSVAALLGAPSGTTKVAPNWS